MITLHQVCSWQVKSLNVPNTAQEKILSDILSGLQHQFSSDREVTMLNIKLASVSSAFYLTLLKHWVWWVLWLNTYKILVVKYIYLLR